jgi:hypothetical protein
MTTPQSQLQFLAERIQHLCRLLDPDEDGVFMAEKVTRADAKMEEISNRLELVQNQMSLIIKLLSKSNVG